MALFFIGTVLLSAHLTYLADKHRVPYLTLLLLFAVALSFLNLNDNHHIDTAGSGTPPKSSSGREQPPALKEQFKAWFKARKEEDDAFKALGRPYPIYVVAAQGGGIYAALHAATVLGRVQDQCSAFSRHVFSISGVSGGSVGASIYAGAAALTADAAKKPMADRGGCHPLGAMPYKQRSAMSVVDAADYALSEDLLSPVVAALLFPDFLQRFLPFGLELMDRGRRLDASFRAAMEAMILRYQPEFGSTWKRSGNLLALRFRDQWSPLGSLPALVINTTEVETGSRRIIAPFVFEGAGRAFFPLWNEAGDPAGHRLANVTVAAAASASARFPWISSPAWFQDFKRDGQGNVVWSGAKEVHILEGPSRLVDGGYFENSGVASAIEMIRAMEIAAKEGKFADRIRIKLIVLTSEEGGRDAFQRFQELWSPVQALLNTRSARASITIAEAERELNDFQGGTEPRVQKVHLRSLEYPPPLGWRLSVVTSLLIRAQAGNADACEGGLPAHLRFDADCLLAGIRRELSGQ
jgi:hypothetical protein